MRISDWSSDVCSSDLLQAALGDRPRWLAASTHPGEEKIVGETQRALKARLPGLITLLAPRHPHRAGQIRRELEALGLVVAQRDRKSVVEGTSGSVRVDLGGGRVLKKNTSKIIT